MNKTEKLLFLLVLTIMLCASSGHAEGYKYATTNMTWAEFYAGETGKASADLLSEGLDAISTPTTHGISRFPLLDSESDDTGSRIYGLKDVQVRMSEEVYNILSNDSRYTFSDDAEFDEYKDVNSDGSFGAMVTDDYYAYDAVVTMATGSSARWGHYVISVSSADIDIGTSNDRIARNYLGVLLQTSDSKIYGMRHDNNIWSNTDIAFTLNENYTEPHGAGTKRFYEYTSDMSGKTITKITYMLKDLPDVVIDGLSLYVKPITSASVAPEKTYAAGKDLAVTLIFSDVSDDADYQFSSLTYGSGRNRIPVTDCTYSEDAKILTINGNVIPGTYTATFSSEKYADIAATITVGDYYAVTDMTWAEFYAGETGSTSSELKTAGLDAVSSPTPRVGARFSQLVSTSNDMGGLDITGVKDVKVKMSAEVYSLLSSDERFTFSSDVFSEYKEVSSDGSFGAMSSDVHEQEGAVITLSAPGTWGTYLLNISSVDITLGSGDTRYYLGATITTSDNKVYGLRHNSNLWFNAGAIAFTTNGNYREPHGVSRDYAYTADLEGKTIKQIRYILKDLPDEIISCDIFLKYQTGASVTPEYESGYHAIMAGYDLPVNLIFSGVSDDVTYELASVFYGTGRNRQRVSGCTMSGDTLIISGAVSEGVYTATFTTDLYSDISAAIQVYTTNATDKIISSDNNPAGLTFLLTPQGVSDATDEVLEANNFVNATDCTDISENYTSVYTGGANQIDGSGFRLSVKLNNVPSGKRGILGFSKNFEITPAKIGTNDFTALVSKILALPDVAYGWRVPTASQLRDMGLIVNAIYPDGVSRDVTNYISSGLYAGEGSVTFSFGTVLIDRAFTASEEGKAYALSDEGEGTMSDGAKDDVITATWYVSRPGGSSSGGGNNEGNDDGNNGSSNNNSNNNDSGGGSSTPSAENETVQISTPSISLTDSKKTEIKNSLSMLSGRISSTTEVAELPSSAVKGNQSVTSSDSSIVYLPIIEVSEDKVYVFGVSLDKFAIYSPIYWYSNAQVTSTGEFVDAADDGEAVIFMNDSGVEVSTVPANKHVNVAAYLQAGRTYNPVIVTENTDEKGVGTSSSGCSSLMGILPAMLAGMLLVFKRIR